MERCNFRRFKWTTNWQNYEHRCSNKKNSYKLPRTTNDVVKVEKNKLVYALGILNKIQESIRFEKANELFKTELFDVA